MKHLLFPMRRIKKYLILLLVTAALLPFCVWSNQHLDISYFTVSLSDLPSGFEGYRIVQLSDLHNAVFGDNDEELIHKIQSLAPDLIVLTGDMIDASTHTDYDKALMLMKQLPAIAATYYVYGNHEVCLPNDKMRDFLSLAETCGIHYLDNELVPLNAENGDSISLIGINDDSLQSSTLEEIMQTQEQKEVHLLLAHEPQFLSDYANTNVDLVFSGHAHGGQIRLPFIGGVYAPDQGLFPQLSEGMHTEHGTVMIISRGLGNSAFPLRMFNHPEIVCVTLSANT